MKIRLFTLPNILTLCNLLCGAISATFALAGELRPAFWLIAGAAVFDFLDGFIARLTRNYSEIGKELDSLADVISFGFAPSAILFCIFQAAGGTQWWGYAVFAVAAFSALRLAKFNIDPSQSDSFEGMPTPAAAIFIASAGYVYASGSYAVQPASVLIIAGCICYFLVSRIRMFAFKFHHYGLRGNELRYGFLAGAAIALAIWQITAIPFIVLTYLLISVITVLSPKSAGR